MKKKTKKEKPMLLLNERPLVEQQHYTNVLLEEMRSQIKGIAEYMQVRFDRIDRDFIEIRQEIGGLRKEMDGLQQSFNGLKIFVHDGFDHLENRLGSVENKLGVVDGKVDRLLEKEEEQDVAIASLRARAFPT